MKGIFGYEGRFFSAMDKVGSLFWLNLLTLVCCIPVVTIGASVTACYYVTLKMVRNEEGYLTKSFFKSFRQNFRQGTVIWLITLVFGVIFFLDYRMLGLKEADGSSTVPFANGLFVGICVIAIVFLMISIYVYPVLAKFDNSTKNTVKNALIMSILNFPKTLLLFIINMIFPGLLILSMTTGRALWIIPVVMCFGLSASAYFSSILFAGIFDKYIRPEIPETGDSDTGRAD